MRSSLTASVNTTFLGGNGDKEQKDQNCLILEQKDLNESSFEKSIEKGIIRKQVKIL